MALYFSSDSILSLWIFSARVTWQVQLRNTRGNSRRLDMRSKDTIWLHDVNGFIRFSANYRFVLELCVCSSQPFPLWACVLLVDNLWCDLFVE